MKKLASTFGLLALMLIVTSFTTPEIGGKSTDGGLGDKGTGRGTKISYEIGGKSTDGGLGDNTGKGTGTTTPSTGTGGFSIGGKSTGTGL
ncbi:MAG: hypothetical protein QM710_08235 [Flavobacterium sp.]